MTRGAHDDVSIIGDYSSSGLTDDMLKIYNLINDMQASDALGAAYFMQQKLKMLFDDFPPEENLSVYVDFEVNMVIEEGWLKGALGAYCEVEQSELLTKAEIDAINKGDFTIELFLPNEPDHMSLTELIRKMEIFAVGRPSTVAGIITNLIFHNELISISRERDEVALLPEGREIYELLQQELGEIATVEWSTKLIASLSLVEAGKLSPDVLLLDVFESLYGKQAREEIQSLSWSDPDELYQLPVIEEQGGRIAISTKNS